MSTIGITLGDPTGIGPELVVRILSQGRGPLGEYHYRVYGDPGVLSAARHQLGMAPAEVPAQVEIVPVTRLAPADAMPGRPTPRSGEAQVAYLEAALCDARDGRICGLCTAPIHKASAIAAGLRFPGHTELLAEHLQEGQDQVVMMLAGPSLRVALCTTHMALAEVPAALSVEGIAGVLRTTVLALHRDFGIAAPQVLVAGLNPHAGEEGHFGQEEMRLIRPAIDRARSLPELSAIPGLQLLGPLVPDAVFRAAVHPLDGRRPDAVVAMYHDQGLIPLKLLDFDLGVNVTLGLRIVRTSPDHGVAHDIAGKGRARPDSMLAALRLCQQLLTHRQQAG